ncbi:hypothetical protein EVAR_18601_1 [Eumeta japonica]|uniref:Uncharacterized protein n=1 Tax=Eumeta variegata TaxID=151549 RepID=A0A4C1V3J8_EUMVA|nr:hypothetical protein EVAR_18601_1 [Eumeta japonica]
MIARKRMRPDIRGLSGPVCCANFNCDIASLARPSPLSSLLFVSQRKRLLNREMKVGVRIHSLQAGQSLIVRPRATEGKEHCPTRLEPSLQRDETLQNPSIYIAIAARINIQSGTASKRFPQLLQALKPQ